jgi:hypothetical protein
MFNVAVKTGFETGFERPSCQHSQKIADCFTDEKWDTAMLGNILNCSYRDRAERLRTSVRLSYFCCDALDGWLPNTRHISGLWPQFWAASCELLSHDRTESEIMSAVCHLPQPCKEPITAWLTIFMSFPLPLTSFNKDVKNMFVAISWCHEASWTVRYFDCTWRMITRYESFSIPLEMLVCSYAFEQSTVLW